MEELVPEVLYEDIDLLVVNKPSGMIVYPDGKHDYQALSHWLEKRYPTKDPEKPTFHFVHRIDRETSGVLVVALNEKTHEFLKEQFAEREVRKTYRAFVLGNLKDERGIINKPIGNSRGGIGPRSAKQPHGTMREALTIYKTLARSSSDTGVSGRATYVEVYPKTGRTHQIRVHLSAIGHPIVADVLYGSIGGTKLLGFKRLALHALSIAITMPPTPGSKKPGKEMTFTAPLPEDFLAAERELSSA
jgi:23S rRNA pseudouridine1911/1915/1917 synthase